MKSLLPSTAAPKPVRGLIWGLLSLAVLGMAGCSLMPQTPLAAAPTALPAAQKRALETARYRSLSASLEKIDAETVRKWVDRWSAPQAGARLNESREVRIDIEPLARRHPAWALADALEMGAIAPDSPQIARELAVTTPDLGRARVGTTAFSSATLPARTIGENFDDSAARKRQDVSLDRFFDSVAARDALRQRDEEFLSRRALEDAIAAAQRGAVEEVDLASLSPEEVLELTNLRLQLLRNLSKTPAERAATRREIEIIEARYVEILSRQTALQEARLREATRDLPMRQRREGLAELQRKARLEAQNRAVARRQVSAGARIRLSRDFGGDRADLRLVLPPARTVAGIAPPARPQTARFFETPPLLGASAARDKRNGDLASPARFEAATTSMLRAKARAEARQWAILVAAQLGSRWNPNPANPNRTAAALAILFPSAPL